MTRIIQKDSELVLKILREGGDLTDTRFTESARLFSRAGHFECFVNYYLVKRLIADGLLTAEPRCIRKMVVGNRFILTEKGRGNENNNPLQKGNGNERMDRS